MARPNRVLSPNVLSAGLLALLAACSSPPDTGHLAAVRQELDAARADAGVVRFGAVPLQEAQASYRRAEAAQRAGDIPEAEHQLYVSERQLEVARSRASEQAALSERQSLALQSAESRAARLEEELEGLRQRQTPQGTVFTLTDVFFETGKAQLKPGAVARLQPLATFLKNNPGKAITIEGHTDSTGSAETNRMLSQRRAEAVRDALIGDGIEPQRLIARGMGEELPIAGNDTAAGRQQNRRVEVLVSELPR